MPTSPSPLPAEAATADAPATSAPGAGPVHTSLPVRRLSVDEYRALGETGVFHEDAPIELIDGLLVAMPPIGPEHAERSIDLPYLFYRRIFELDRDDLRVSVQTSLELNDRSEPEPDLVLLRRPAGERRGVPRASEALLVVEIAQSTLATDRAEKVPRYAAAGIPEAWVVALPEGVVDVYRGPTPEGYRTHHRLRPGDTVAVEALPTLAPFAVAEVLGVPGEGVDSPN